MSLLSEVFKTVVDCNNLKIQEGYFKSIECTNQSVNNVVSESAIITGPLTLVDSTDESKQGTLLQIGDTTVFSDIPSCAVVPTANFHLCNKQYVDATVGGGCLQVNTTLNSTNANFYPTFVTSSATGYQALNVDSGLKYNPSTDTLTVTNINGSVASTSQVNITANATNAVFYPVLAASAASGLQSINVNSGLQYNPSSDTLTVNVVAATASGSASQVSTTATSTNTDFYPTFVPASTTGQQAIGVDSGLKCNPSSNTLTTTNVTGNASSTTMINTTNTSTNADFYPTFVGSLTPGNQVLYSDSGFKYNPFTDTLTVTNLAGSISSSNQVSTTATSTNADFYPTFVASSSTGPQAINLDSGLKYNPFTNTLTVSNVIVNSTSSVETVTGTNPIDPDVSITLLGGTTHTLPSGTTIGQQKTIVKNTDNAFTPILDNVTQTTGATVFNALKYDPVFNRMYVGGIFLTIGGIPNTLNIAFFDFATNTWNAMSTGLGISTSVVLDIIVTPNGLNVYVCGSFATPGNNITVFDKNTGTFSALGTGLNNTCNRLLLHNNYLYAVGQFTQAGGLTNGKRVARWNITSSTWETLEGGLTANASALTVDGTDIWIGGQFLNALTAAGSAILYTQYLAKFDTITLTFGGYGANNFLVGQRVNVLLTLSPGTILLSGLFTGFGDMGVNGSPLPLYYTATMQTSTFTFTQYGYLTTNNTRFFIDNDNVVWALGGTQLGSVDIVGAQGTYSRVEPPYFYDSIAGKWCGLLGLSSNAVSDMAATNVPGEYWVSSGSYIDGGTLTGTGNLLKLNKFNLVKVSSQLIVNGETDRNRFHLIWKGQTVTLQNLNNTEWVVTSSSLVSIPTGSGGQGQVFFY